MIEEGVTDSTLSTVCAKVLRCVQRKISLIEAHTITKVNVNFEDALTRADFDAVEQFDDEDILVKEQNLVSSKKEKKRVFEVMLATKHPIGICSVKLTWRFDDKEDLK